MSKDLVSLQHPLVKHLVKLREKREYRSHCNSALVSGIKLIEELSCSHRFKAVVIEKEYTPLFPINADQVYVVSRALLKKVTGLVNPEPIAAEISLPVQANLHQMEYLLILDGICDPGNMGTLLRTALAMGWQGVLITPGSTDPFNEKAIRAAKGACFKIPLKQASWEEVHCLLDAFEGPIFAADIHGEPIKTSNALPCALVLGNESIGLSEQIRKKAKTIAIPMEKEMESLNVACAGAILMHLLKEANDL